MNQAHRHAQSSGPDTVKGSSRAARRAGTAAAVARLHDGHPHLTAASIGERLGVERTVLRHWRPACSPAGPAASRGRIWSCPRWCCSPEVCMTQQVPRAGHGSCGRLLLPAHGWSCCLDSGVSWVFHALQPWAAGQRRPAHAVAGRLYATQAGRPPSRSPPRVSLAAPSGAGGLA